MCNVCTVFMKGKGVKLWVCQPLSESWEDNYCEAKIICKLRWQLTHGRRGCNSFPTPPKRIVEQTIFPELPDPFLPWILEWLKFSFEEDADGFFLRKGLLIFNFYGSSLALGLPQFWNKVNKIIINGCIVNIPMDLGACAKVKEQFFTHVINNIIFF